MVSLIDDLSDMPIKRPLDLLLSRAVGVRALVIAPGVLAPLHLLLAVFPPIVPVIGSPVRLLLIVRVTIIGWLTGLSVAAAAHVQVVVTSIM